MIILHQKSKLQWLEIELETVYLRGGTTLLPLLLFRDIHYIPWVEHIGIFPQAL